VRKGNKSDYLVAIKSLLGNSWSEKDKLPPSDEAVVLIVDAMAFVQCHQQLGSKNFCELQDNYLQQQLLGSMPDNCRCINFVGDRYDISPAESLKGEERRHTPAR